MRVSVCVFFLLRSAVPLAEAETHLGLSYKDVSRTLLGGFPCEFDLEGRCNQAL